MEISQLELKKHVFEVAGASNLRDTTAMLMSHDIETKLAYTYNYPIRWSDEMNCFVLDVGIKIKIYAVEEKIIGNRILILNKDAVWLQTKEQRNYVTNTVERLSVDVSEGAIKTRFEIKTVIKLEIHDLAKLRFLKINDIE